MVWCLLGAFACGGSDDPETGAGSAASGGSLGFLAVDRAADQDTALESRTTLSAAFVRYHGLDGDEVVRLFGATPPGELDSCAPIEAPDGDLLEVPDAEVELIDVGPIEVRLGEATTRLEPRTFPALGSVLGGSFYAGDADLGVPRPDLDAYVFSAPAVAEGSGLEIAVAAPPGPGDVTVDGLDATRLPTLIRGRDSELVWDAGSATHVEIEITAARRAIGCIARDDGTFLVDGAVLSLLGADRAARLSVRRVRVTPFEMREVEQAWLRASATRSFPVTVR